jgi:hypothetical protein
MPRRNAVMARRCRRNGPAENPLCNFLGHALQDDTAADAADSGG